MQKAGRRLASGTEQFHLQCCRWDAWMAFSKNGASLLSWSGCGHDFPVAVTVVHIDAVMQILGDRSLDRVEVVLVAVLLAS